METTQLTVAEIWAAEFIRKQPAHGCTTTVDTNLLHQLLTYIAIHGTDLTNAQQALEARMIIDRSIK